MAEDDQGACCYGITACRRLPVQLRLAVKDDVLQPPVLRFHRIPSGRLVTVELDQNEAVKNRGRKLAQIANFWLLGQASEVAEMRIDHRRTAAYVVRATVR